MAFKRWKFALIIIIVWFGIVAYIGSGDFFSSAVDMERLQKTKDLLSESQLYVKKLKRDVEVLKEELVACELRKTLTAKETEATGAKFTKVKQEHVAGDKSKQHAGAAAPSLQLEKARRRASKELREMWYFLSAEITKINKGVNDKTRKRLTQLLDEFMEIHHALSNNMEIVNNEELSIWRKREHENLSKLVQKRLHRLQNPADCQAAKKLVCELNKGCGYGCQVHHLLYCFIVAYGSRRTLILNSNNWRYSPEKGWEGVFVPISESCTTTSGPVENWSIGSENSQNVILPIVDGLYPKPKHLPLAIPADLADQLQRLHGFPFAWWIGQFAKYLFRYQPEVQNEINEKKERLGFRYPIVG